MSVQIVKPIGSTTMPLVLADCFEKDVLTLTHWLTEATVQVLQPDEWLECQVYSERTGHLEYTLINSQRAANEARAREQIHRLPSFQKAS